MEKALEAAKAAGGAGGGPPNVSLKREREAIAAQFAADPGLKDLLMASVQAEVGNQNPATQLKYIETVLNRAAAEKAKGIKSKGDLRALLTSAHSQGGYYPDKTINALGNRVSGPKALALTGLINTALGGSNQSEFRNRQ